MGTFAVGVKGVLLLSRPVFPSLCLRGINTDLYFSVQDTRASNESIVVVRPFYQACRTLIKALKNVTM